jgi:hypothetical protein
MDRRDAILSITTVLGYTVAPASILSLSSSCNKPGPGLSWVPQFFDQEGASIIERLGEAILPKTDTPGSIDVGAHIFVDSFLNSVATDADQQTCKLGLDYWKSDYQKRQGKPLVEASDSELQQELADLFDVDHQEQQQLMELMRSDPPSNSEEKERYYVYSFLMMFKKTLMLGYFASEQIGENVLSYLPIPGRYDGCIPADEVGNAWAL